MEILEENAMHSAKASSLLSPVWNKLGNSVGKNVNGLMYSHMISTIALTEVQQLYTTMSIWQDNPASIQALGAFIAFFSRIPHDKQTPKMADMLLIE